MKYTFTITPYEQLNAHVEYNKVMLPRKFSLSFLFGIFTGILLFLDHRLIAMWEDFVLCGGGITLGFFFIFYFIPFLITFSRLNNLKKDIHLNVADKYLYLQNADYGKKQYYSWRKVKKTKETKSFYRIIFEDYTAVSIPKEMITPESLNFISSKLSRS